MKQPETKRRIKIRKFVKDIFGGFWIKVWGGPFQSAGIPDYICCINGLFIALEVKVEGNEASALQLDAIREINSSGGYAAVVYTEEEAVWVVCTAVASSKGRRKFIVDEKGCLLLNGTRYREDVYNLSIFDYPKLQAIDRDCLNRVSRKCSGRMA